MMEVYACVNDSDHDAAPRLPDDSLVRAIVNADGLTRAIIERIAHRRC